MKKGEVGFWRVVTSSNPKLVWGLGRGVTPSSPPPPPSPPLGSHFFHFLFFFFSLFVWVPLPHTEKPKLIGGILRPCEHCAGCST